MDILILGKGQLAIDVCRHLQIQGSNLIVIPVDPEPTWAPSLSEYCLREKIPTLTWEKFRLEENRYPVGVSVFFDKIFKPTDISKFKLLLNIHNAPLPKYRGVNPINWALKNGEQTHGVTIHRISETIDTGEIYGQKTFPINSETDEVEDVYKRCLKFGLELFIEVFDNLEHINPWPQNELEASYYSKHDFERLEDRKGFRRVELLH